MPTFAHNVLEFNKNLSYTGALLPNIRVMNPFKENPEILATSELFYNKYYSDTKPRKLILGINPGRLGAGVTGIPFTDTKRLQEICGIQIDSVQTHEPSSVFIYDLIDTYGGSDRFYKDFYINSVCPLGFIRKNEKGNWVNCNYYDYEALFNSTKEFIITSLKKQIAFGIDTSVVYILGKKNATFFNRINSEEKLFDRIVVFDHPRYIVQYKSKQKDQYLDEYLRLLK